MHTYTLYTSISLIGLYTCMKKGRLVYCYSLFIYLFILGGGSKHKLVYTEDSLVCAQHNLNLNFLQGSKLKTRQSPQVNYIVPMNM